MTADVDVDGEEYDGRHYCDQAGREVIGLGGRERCPYCWRTVDDLRELEGGDDR